MPAQMVDLSPAKFTVVLTPIETVIDCDVAGKSTQDTRWTPTTYVPPGTFSNAYAPCESVITKLEGEVKRPTRGWARGEPFTVTDPTTRPPVAGTTITVADAEP